MALQTSGPIRGDQIGTEFGDTAPFQLMDMYAGGAYVPAGTTGSSGAIPTSGIIKYTDFYGSQAAPPELNMVINSVYGGVDPVVLPQPSNEYGWSTVGHNYPSYGFGSITAGSANAAGLARLASVVLVSQPLSSGRHGIMFNFFLDGDVLITVTMTDGRQITFNTKGVTPVTETLYRGFQLVYVKQYWVPLPNFTGGGYWNEWNGKPVIIHAAAS